MAGVFTGGTTQTKNGVTTKVNKSGSLPGLSSIASNAQTANAKSNNWLPANNVSALYDVGKTVAPTGKTATGKSSWLSDKFSDIAGAVSNPAELLSTSVGMPGLGSAADKVTGGAASEVASNITGIGSSDTKYPDPMQTALEQMGLSKDLALWVLQQNRENQVTPYGSSTHTQNPDGTWTQNVTLTPQQQNLLDTQTEMQTRLGSATGNLVDQVNNIYSKPIDFSGLPQLSSGTTTKNVSTSPMKDQIDPYGNIKTSIDDAGPIQRQVDTSGINPLTYSANKGNIQSQIDMSGVPSLVGGQDLLGFQNEARDAAWNNAKAALDPQWNSYETGLETKLANQGVMQNSDAWNKAISEMSRNRQYDYSQAQNNAVSQGLTAASQLYNQGLSSNQNAYNQALGRGNFTNAAQAQDFGQNYDNATLGNQASMDMFNARRAVMSDANAAQQQQFGQNEANAVFGNTAQAQGFDQNKSQAEMYNKAKYQEYLQNMGNAELNNSAVNQDYSTSLSTRNQGINELLQQYQMPLSALTSIMGGTQPTMPQFSATPQISGVSAPDYTGLVAGNTAAKTGTSNSILSGGVSALTSILPLIL